MSSFLLDVKQLTDAINGSTRNSLLLIDELGRGTQLEDGQAIVLATIRYFVSSLARLESMHSPLVFLSTHSYEMFYLRKYIYDRNMMERLQFLSFTNMFEGKSIY